MAPYNVSDMRSYIRSAAQKRGIDPETAVRVAGSEGLGDGIWQSNYRKGGIREPSYGPFQLLVGGSGTGFPGGMGNDFKRQTGLDPSNPKNVRQTVDFALDHAAQNGWGAWYGANKVGIGDWQGIGDGASAAGVSSSSAGGDGFMRASLPSGPNAPVPGQPPNSAGGGNSDTIALETVDVLPTRPDGLAPLGEPQTVGPPPGANANFMRSGMGRSFDTSSSTGRVGGNDPTFSDRLSNAVNGKGFFDTGMGNGGDAAEAVSENGKFGKGSPLMSMTSGVTQALASASKGPDFGPAQAPAEAHKPQVLAGLPTAGQSRRQKRRQQGSGRYARLGSGKGLFG